MDELIYVAPAQERAVFFARWIVGNRLDHRVSYPGYMLAPGEYAAVPPELLEGATVDGFPYGIESPQPEPPAAASAPQAPPQTVTEAKPRQPRKRAPRKRAAAKRAAPAPTGQVPGQMTLDEAFDGLQSGD